MSKNIFIGALILGVIILLYFLFHEPKQTDSHTDDYELVKAERDTLKVHKAMADKNIDSLSNVVEGRDYFILSLTAETKVARTELDKSKSKAQLLASELHQYKQRDTTAYGQKVDSLVAEVENLTFLLNQYENYSDSLTTVNEQQRADMATVTNEQQNIYKELNDAYDRVSKQYDNLFKDYQTAKKSIKRERLKTKIAAVLALVGGAAAVLK